MPPMLKTDEELLAALEAKTIKIHGCWLWQGKLDTGGYGRISFRGKLTRVHRASAYLHLGLDLNDEIQQINHHVVCVNTNCWNPEHLYIGTKTDNAYDRILAEGIMNCPHGHPLDGMNNRGKRYCKTCVRLYNWRKRNGQAISKTPMPTLPE